MPEHDCKPWIASRTIWGALTIMLIAFALLALGVVALANDADPALALTAIIAALVQLPAGLLTIIGRVDATQRIERRSVLPDGDVPRTLAWGALACILFVPLCGCTTAQEDRGALGYTSAAIDLDFNFDGVARQSQPHVPLSDASSEPQPDVAALQELVSGAISGDAAATAQQSEQLASRRGNVVIIGTLNVTVSGGNAAESRDSGGQNADGPSTSASLPVQLNTAGGAGTQGDTASTTTPGVAAAGN